VQNKYFKTNFGESTNKRSLDYTYRLSTGINLFKKIVYYSFKFNQVSGFGSGSVFETRIRIQEGKNDPK
jgi:hypothetical protein